MKTERNEQTIVIPLLERVIYQEPGSKNSIRQLIQPGIIIPLNIIKSERNLTVIEHDSKQYCFISNIETNVENYDYVLLTNIIPTKERFKNEQIKIKKWIKNPFLKIHSVDDVLISWKDDFFYKEEDPANGLHGLRQPQVAALHSIMGHLKLPLDAGTVVMPTGTGKTETMLSALVANQCQKLLVTVPSDSLRGQISQKFLTLGLLKEFKVVGNSALYPIVGVIHNRFSSIEVLEAFLYDCNVIVTTMSWLTEQPISVQHKIATVCSHVFIDEAHHVKANSWNEFRNRFEKEKIIQFTATPFRNDGKRLEGKIISNFPLRKAQEQGYYKRIEFISVREYQNDKADAKIAKVAIERLRSDISKGLNHILMARCATKERANEIYSLYECETDLNPVKLYSGVPNFKDTYSKIIEKRAKIIVCVDMLGEGFDLPELKIAAFHDIRKSLPITLQLAGRFTRTKYDEQLGDAAFIANIADLNVRTELADLYAADADWNEILSDTSFERINEQVEFKDFMAGFNKLSDANIPFQNIKPKLSTVVYKNKTDTWFPTNFHTGIGGYKDLDFKFYDLNSEQRFLVIVTGKKFDVDWVHHKEIQNVQWDIILVYWETKNNLLFINSSDNSSVYEDLAIAIIGKDAELIRGLPVFKSFYNIKRVKLQNVGLRQFLGKNIRFRMMVGSDVAEALSLAERQRGEKAFVMGAGYEDGKPVNIGASYKGRIWTKLAGDLKDYKKWCEALGKKLVDETIDPNQILKETLIPTMITEIPNVQPVWIDWDVDMYIDIETKFKFRIGGISYDMSNVELCLEGTDQDKNIMFSLFAEDKKAIFKLRMFENQDGVDHFPDFKIIQISSEPVEVQYGNRTASGQDFFDKYIPTIWFADGSALTGNEYIELKQSIQVYPKDEIIVWDWSNVDLHNEAQGISPKKTDSIQYKVIQQLKLEDYDIIYDDDYSGEIADVIAMKLEPERIIVKLYHLKYASDGVVSNQIKNFYEVCGQAQKSIHWKHKDGRTFINHLLRRETKSKNGQSCSRLEKGNHSDLLKLLNVIKNEIPTEFEIFIVQPGLSKSNASHEILTLLGVTENYVKEFADVNLKVIASI